jgi:tripeptide aminopeptidase
MSLDFKNELAERLIRYASIDSQSDEESATVPSSKIQYDMLYLLEKELKELNLIDVKITDYGTLIATIPGKIKGAAIGFLAHVDTAPQFNASNVKPRIIKNYDGSDIKFPDDENLILSPKEFSYLSEKIGHDIITASGKTLLGADDKAGIAIIMTAVNFLISKQNENHSEIRIAFTTDEEIGRGVHKNLPDDLNVKFAYTFDGGKVGEIDNETFSADSAEVLIKGVSIHPGDAKNEMVNAIHLASEIINNLPLKTMTPEVTEKREGFIHATDMIGNSSEMIIKFILRDFELKGLD